MGEQQGRRAHPGRRDSLEDGADGGTKETYSGDVD